MTEVRRLRSVRGLPELPKLPTLSVAFDEEFKYGKSPAVENLSNNDGHLYQPSVSEEPASHDGPIDAEPKQDASQHDAFSFQDSVEDLVRKPQTEGEHNSFRPPPQSEVLKYSRKPLPEVPTQDKTPKEKIEHEVQEMMLSVPVYKPTVYLQPAVVRGSCVASLHAVVEDDLPAATNQTQPVPTAWFNRIQKREQWSNKLHDGQRYSMRSRD